MLENRNRLRIALIFEELKEYSEASGLRGYFDSLCEDASGEYERLTNLEDDEPQFTEKINLVEQFDALLDLQYVLSGAVIENGFKDIFDEGFEAVHNSNISKAVNNSDELLATFEKYQKEGIDVYFGSNGNNLEEDTVFPTPVYRCSDNKVMKNINYNPVNLKPFIYG